MDRVYYIYTISLGSKVMYVGQTTDFETRKWFHLNYIGKKRSAIPVDVNLASVEFDILAECFDRSEALALEDHYIQLFDTINFGWNKQRSGLITKDKEYRRTCRQNNSEHYKQYGKEYWGWYYEAHKEELKRKRRERYVNKERRS